MDFGLLSLLEGARHLAKEIVGLASGVILARSTPAAAALKAEMQTIDCRGPIVSGLVASLSHPGGNITGFTDYEASIGGKWRRDCHQGAA
jgi:putative tryptophan/tyrosine transport system substrate-binding protein